MSKLNSFAFDAWLTHDSSLDEVDTPECNECGAPTEIVEYGDEDGITYSFECAECEAKAKAKVAEEPEQ
jgi:hypothetical protein